MKGKKTSYPFTKGKTLEERFNELKDLVNHQTVVIIDLEERMQKLEIMMR